MEFCHLNSIFRIEPRLMCRCWCTGCLCLGFVFQAFADQSLGWLWPGEPRTLGSLCMCLLCTSRACLSSMVSFSLVILLDPPGSNLYTRKGKWGFTRIDLHPGTDMWVGPSTALYFVSPQDVARTLYQHDQWVTSAAKRQSSKTTWLRLQGNPSQRSRRTLSQMRGPSLPGFVRESRAQDVSSSQRPRRSVSADAAFVGWESRWPGEDIRVDVVPEWKFVWTSGYYFFR